MHDLTARAPVRLLACDGAESFATSVAGALQLPLVPTQDSWFSCGEGKFVIDENVRGGDCYVFQSPIVPGAERSVYDRFVMLLHAVEATALADAQEVTAVVPYFPGARQDKRKGRVREGISAGLFARCLQEAGATRVITVEVHNEAIAGMFAPWRCRLENLYLHYLMCPWLCERGLVGDTVVAPDVGGMERARRYGEVLESHLAALSKERDYSTVNRVVRSTLIGEVAGHDVLLVDDIIDTAGSVVAAVDELKAGKARSVTVACAHAVFSEPALERLSGVADRAQREGWRFTVVGSSSIRQVDPPPWYVEFPIEGLIARVIERNNHRLSVTGAQER